MVLMGNNPLHTLGRRRNLVVIHNKEEPLENNWYCVKQPQLRLGPQATHYLGTRAIQGEQSSANDLAVYTCGIPWKEGLLQQIQGSQEHFRKTVQSTTPDFRLYE
ncbi:hypothetical protein C8J56DRAFT_890325 [Mycena floridula]|nr:hypothetical protein C8J56DRAFT_890325 [Mycena floridula]